MLFCKMLISSSSCFSKRNQTKINNKIDKKVSYDTYNSHNNANNVNITNNQLESGQLNGRNRIIPNDKYRNQRQNLSMGIGKNAKIK